MKRFRARVVVTLQDGMLDPQGEAVARVAREIGLDAVQAVRCGKVIDLKLLAPDREEAQKAAMLLREKLLTNPATEQSELDFLKEI